MQPTNGVAILYSSVCSAKLQQIIGIQTNVTLKYKPSTDLYVYIYIYTHTHTHTHTHTLKKKKSKQQDIIQSVSITKSAVMISLC